MEQDRLVAVWGRAMVTAVVMVRPMAQVLVVVADLEAAVDSAVVGVLAGAPTKALAGARALEPAMVAVTGGDFQVSPATTRARVLAGAPQVVTYRQGPCRLRPRSRRRW